MTSLLTPLALSLPDTIPFVGPEAIERRTGRPTPTLSRSLRLGGPPLTS